MLVEPIDHTDADTKARSLEFLAPDEPHALFLLGNLRRAFPGTHLYVAVRGGKWVGMAGYYDGPKSLIPYSRDPEVIRALVRFMVRAHPDVRWLNGIEYAAAPAYAELQQLGYLPDNDPHQVFMELEGVPPAQEHEDLVRPIRPEDAPPVARLMRLLQSSTPPGAPVTDEEVERIRLNPLRYVLETGGRVVSTACTNGMGLTAFQILGVATAPDCRGRGYAGATCASLIRAMQGEGAERCVLFTHRENRSARRCYEKLGFRITGAYYVARLAPPRSRP